jgi:hypothetical protein
MELTIFRKQALDACWFRERYRQAYPAGSATRRVHIYVLKPPPLRILRYCATVVGTPAEFGLMSRS